MTETEGTRDLRAIAADWHGGQWSPLYAYASTGTVIDGAAREVRDCLAEVTAHPDRYAPRDRVELVALLDHVQLEEWLTQSKYLGADAALAAASWLILSETQCRSILDDVDPEVVDAISEPNLSGEFADDLTPDLLAEEVGLTRDQLTVCPDGPEVVDAIATAWEEGRDLVWWDAVQATALRTLGEIPRALEVERENERKVDELRKVAGL